MQSRDGENEDKEKKKKRQNKRETEKGEIRKKRDNFLNVFCFWFFVVVVVKKEGKRTISEEVCELYDKNRSLACKSSGYM